MDKQHKTKVDELRNALKHKSEEAKKDSEESVKVKETTADDLSAQLLAAEEEAHGHYDKLLRVMAEFENFKRRMAKEREEQFKYANEKILNELLPALDDLDRVLEHVPPDASEESKKIAEGVEIVRKSLSGVLEKFGLKEIEAYDQVFDPTRHEAIAVVESEAHEPDHIVAVHRKGYWLGDRLLRPAMVTVSKKS